MNSRCCSCKQARTLISSGGDHRSYFLLLSSSSFLALPSSIIPLTSYISSMSEIGDSIQAKCLAFGDRVIKLNDYLLKEAANKKSEGGSQKADRRGNSQTSYVRHQTCRIPVHLQAIATLCNQLLGLERQSERITLKQPAV